MRQVYIYALCEPDQPWNIRYVGKTVSTLQRRLSQHLARCHLKTNTYKNNWIKSLLQSGKKPTILLVDIGDELSWEALERFYISSYRSAGFVLTNATDGGEGSLGILQSTESRSKRSRSLLGEKHPAFGKSFSEEHRKNLSLAHMGKDSRSGMKHSPEARAKLSKATKEHWRKKKEVAKILIE